MHALYGRIRVIIMTMINENLNSTKGVLFVNELITGEFKKDYHMNCCPDFTEGLEELYHHVFEMYISSCGCFLMDKRLTRVEYYG